MYFKQVAQNETNLFRSDDAYAKDRIKSARLKLNEINPAVISGSDLILNNFLRSSNLKDARRQIDNKCAQILLKYNSNHYHKLTVDEQIDSIIDPATDADTLGRSWG
ncbi:unnamed protein product [Rotaria sp. Silwood2]|nr:unnamed protein product [Rotaria sp. Silwood2]